MRIAIWHNLPSGGAKRALYDQVRGLLGRGHLIQSWCPPTADQGYLPLGDLIPEHVIPLEWPQPREGGLWNRVVEPYREVVTQLRAMERHCRDCAQQINGSGFDVLFANACRFFRVTPIARFTDPPKVLYLPEPFRWLYEALPELPW